MVAKRAERRTAAKPAARLERRRFSVDEYDRLIEAGILQEDEHVELLGGEIVCMSPIGKKHQGRLDRFTRWFSRRLPDSAMFRVQGSFRLDDGSEPEPDLLLLRFREDYYENALPTASDVLLVIEVADTSLAHDRDVKGPLYAAAGIPDYWLLDLTGEQILVQREPKRGRYTKIEAVRRGGTLAPLAFPDLVLPLDELLGPAPQA
jgi:Uma2 family endonuclease